VSIDPLIKAWIYKVIDYNVSIHSEEFLYLHRFINSIHHAFRPVDVNQCAEHVLKVVNDNPDQSETINTIIQTVDWNNIYDFENKEYNFENITKTKNIDRGEYISRSYTAEVAMTLTGFFALW
jgi:hypothetical protein